MLLKRTITFLSLFVCLPTLAQSGWDFRHRAEVRASYRDSDPERFLLRFTLPPEILPVGETSAFMETVDPGQHVELSVANLQLDARFESWFHARAKVHAVDKHRRNPTSNDRMVDIDELFLVIGDMPEFLERPEKTSLFLLMGKAPRMERQPLRLLESYGLAATSFNRFEDVQAIVGGTIGRNFYWRLQAGNGNPLYFRDANALAGDNGVPELRERVAPELGSGFPILYNAESEDLFFNGENTQFGQAIGYRWANESQSVGFDAIVFHYQRDLAFSVDLTGSFYGGDLDLLNGPFDGGFGGIPLTGRNKEETGARIYSELLGLTTIAQFTAQEIAGLNRQAWEVEAGYRLALPWKFVPYIQPAVRMSDLQNSFSGNAMLHPTPSLWWDWEKLDIGVRIGFAHNIDLTIERSTHEVEAPRELDLDETLATIRWRM